MKMRQADKNIAVLSGDGIGPEVVRETNIFIEWFNKNKSLMSLTKKEIFNIG